MSSSSACYFTKCCFCIPLETGCFIIGYLNLVGSIIATVLTGVGIGAISAMSNESKTDKEVSAAIIVVLVIVFILMALSLAFSIVLLVGLHKNKPGHVKAYIIYTAVFLAIYALLFFASFATAKVDASTIITRILQILLSVYYMLVIRSHYINMKGTNNQIA